MVGLARDRGLDLVAIVQEKVVMRQIISFGSAPVSPYSVAVSAGGFIYLSGTLAEDLDGESGAEPGVATETRRTLERMRDVLHAAGSSLDDVVAVMVYLTTAADFQAMNRAYRAFWPGDPPTRTTVITTLVVPGARIEISMVAVPRGAERTVVLPDGWNKSPNPYSYAIRSGDMLFLSGLVARRGADNTFVAGDVQVQTRAIMDNAGQLLRAAGLSFRDVVSARIYLTSASDFLAMNEVYREFFPEAPPARATVQSGLAGPEAVVEITFIASSAERRAIGAPPSGLPLSPAICAGERLFVSGMLGNTPDTAGDVAAQTRETLTRIGRTLADAGASPADVVEGLVYLTDASSFATMNAEYRAFFGGEFPARATVVTPLVAGDALVEIMVTAVVPATRGPRT
jgi:reactive intermediate/imine deaminase